MARFLEAANYLITISLRQAKISYIQRETQDQEINARVR